MRYFNADSDVQSDKIVYQYCSHLLQCRDIDFDYCLFSEIIPMYKLLSQLKNSNKRKSDKDEKEEGEIYNVGT